MKRFLLTATLVLALCTSAFAAKTLDISVQTGGLTKFATATHLTFCSTQPANYAAVAGVKLAGATLTAGIGGASYTQATGDAGAGSLKVTVAAQTAMTPTANGTITYACGDDGTTLLWCTTVTSQAVTTAQSWNSPAFKLEWGVPQ